MKPKEVVDKALELCPNIKELEQFICTAQKENKCNNYQTAHDIRVDLWLLDLAKAIQSLVKRLENLPK